VEWPPSVPENSVSAVATRDEAERPCTVAERNASGRPRTARWWVGLVSPTATGPAALVDDRLSSGRRSQPERFPRRDIMPQLSTTIISSLWQTHVLIAESAAIPCTCDAGVPRCRDARH